MNIYPLWKNLLVLGVVVVGVVLALPNMFGSDPSLNVSRDDGTPVPEATVERIEKTLGEHEIDYLSAARQDNGSMLLRFPDFDAQLRANDTLEDAFPDLVVAMTLATRSPEILQAAGLEPMSLGLDLRGGVHFLYQVDLEEALQQYLATLERDLRTRLREADIRNRTRVGDDALLVQLLEPTEASLAEAEDIIQDLGDAGNITGQLTQRLIVTPATIDGMRGFRVEPSEQLITERQNFAIQQNITTLRNRVNELGVAEPVIQQQGGDRILVELPGIQDPAAAERVLNTTATLEYRLVDNEGNVVEAAERGRAPVGSELFPCEGAAVDWCVPTEEGPMTLLDRDVISTGDQITDATWRYDQGQPAVFVSLNAAGADRMFEVTSRNVGQPMATVYIEQTPRVVERDGEEVIETETSETVIMIATIQDVLSNTFRTTGLTPFEAQDLALLLRSGALAVPIVKVEERTIGPSLGQQNIEQGRNAVVIGFLLVVAFMAVYYRAFGLVANLALLANLVLIVALLSLLQATLTLPGIAGIVLTVGMAVDANVLIFERIREELRNGNSPQASIRAGYEKAFSTIADANITTFIAAIVLFGFGTGPIKGFAVTLSLGILTSMFTAIVGTRCVVNLVYGGRRQVRRLAIGGGL